jgi:hypothetical protein
MPFTWARNLPVDVSSTSHTLVPKVLEVSEVPEVPEVQPAVMCHLQARAPLPVLAPGS